jgi:hypothetical protein
MRFGRYEGLVICAWDVGLRGSLAAFVTQVHAETTVDPSLDKAGLIWYTVRPLAIQRLERVLFAPGVGATRDALCLLPEATYHGLARLKKYYQEGMLVPDCIYSMTNKGRSKAAPLPLTELRSDRRALGPRGMSLQCPHSKGYSGHAAEVYLCPPSHSLAYFGFSQHRPSH